MTSRTTCFVKVRSHRRISALLGITMLSVTFSLSAWASNDGSSLIGFLSLLCVTQQDPQHVTPVGRKIVEEAGYQQFRAKLGEQTLDCIAARSLVPKDACTELLDNSTASINHPSSAMESALGNLRSIVETLETECIQRK